LKERSGADVSLLKGMHWFGGFETDSQRYFIHHHSEMDTLINHREIGDGAATMAALVYLTDQLGLNKNRFFPANFP